MKGIDYQFYRELLAGRYDAEINRGMSDVRHGAELYEGTLIKA